MRYVLARVNQTDNFLVRISVCDQFVQVGVLGYLYVAHIAKSETHSKKRTEKKAMQTAFEQSYKKAIADQKCFPDRGGVK